MAARIGSGVRDAERATGAALYFADRLDATYLTRSFPELKWLLADAVRYAAGPPLSAEVVVDVSPGDTAVVVVAVPLSEGRAVVVVSPETAVVVVAAATDVVVVVSITSVV